ncbi:hypothetical protein Dimus_020670, partial [Dionaea muscipula]
MAVQQLREGRPGRGKRIGMARERRFHRNTDAVDMNMQLLLRPPMHGIDGKAEILSRQHAAQPRPDQPAFAPSFRKIIGRAGLQQSRALNAGDARRGDQQILRLPGNILEDGIAGSQIHAGTGRGMAEALLVNDAAAIDDLPQDHGVARRTKEDDGQEGHDNRGHHEQGARRETLSLPPSLGKAH